MDGNDFRWSELARYHDAAIEHGLVLISLSQMALNSNLDKHDRLGPRASVRAITEMLLFCIHARKAIEVSDKRLPGIKNASYKSFLASKGQLVSTYKDIKHKITDLSFCDITSRIIHSQFSHVEYEFENYENYQRRPKYFVVQSDKDLNKQTHTFPVEELIAVYLNILSSKIEEAIRMSK